MKCPLVVLGVAYAVGVFIGDFFPAPLGVLFLVTALGLALSLLSPFGWMGLLLAALVMAGWTRQRMAVDLISPHDLRRVVAERYEYTTVRGVLSQVPKQRLVERRGKASIRTIATLEASAMQRGDRWLPIVGAVRVTTPGELPEAVQAGCHVEVSGLLHGPPGATVPGLFDYRSYLARQGVHYQLAVGSSGGWQVVQPARGLARMNPLERFGGWARRTLSLGLEDTDASVRLMWALALGWKTALTDEVSEPFMRSGTMHLFAISGLHIVLLSGILLEVLGLFRVPRAIRGVVTVPLLWFYTAATGWQASAIRATLMMSLVVGGWALSRPGNLLNSLAAAGLLILLWEPQQLFQASFQLSFFVVLSIALLVPPMKARLEAWLAPDPLLPADLRPRWRRWVVPPVHYLGGSLATSTAAWVGALPLVAFYFHLVTPVSLIANLVVVPLGCLALMSSLGSLCCGGWLTSASVLFNHSAWLFIGWMAAFSEWSTTWPLAFFYVSAPSLAWCGAWYAALICFAALVVGRRFARVGLGLALAGVLLGAVQQVWRGSTEARFGVLALDGGQSVFVDLPGTGGDHLIDTGDAGSADFVVRPFLRAQGVDRLGAVVLSHGDARHVGGAEFLAQEFPIDEWVVNGMRFRSSVYRRVLESQTSGPASIRTVLAGAQWRDWRVLHPAREDRATAADDAALVLLGEWFDHRVLVCLDLGESGQQVLAQRWSGPGVDLVITSAPARGTPLADPLLRVLRPSVVVLAGGAAAGLAAADPADCQRLQDAGTRVIALGSRDGLQITVRRQGLRFEPVDAQEHRRVREERKRDPARSRRTPRRYRRLLGRRPSARHRDKARPSRRDAPGRPLCRESAAKPEAGRSTDARRPAG
jgi:ComEC/Rec2-related protein